jgi:hypothetical protein
VNDIFKIGDAQIRDTMTSRRDSTAWEIQCFRSYKRRKKKRGQSTDKRTRTERRSWPALYANIAE